MSKLDWALLRNNASKVDIFLGPPDPEELAAVIALYTPDPELWARVQTMAKLGMSQGSDVYRKLDAVTIASYWRAIAGAELFYPNGLPCTGGWAKLPDPYHRMGLGIMKAMCGYRFLLLRKVSIPGGCAFFPRQPTEHDHNIVAERRRRRIAYVERRHSTDS